MVELSSTLSGPFDPNLAQLPSTLPIFPLTGVILLPRGRLPLNVFEPRYLGMTEDALAHGRMIGVVQPQELATHNSPPSLYQIGCAGRIAAFSETDDGRFLITLLGVCRFKIIQELETTKGYRRGQVEWQNFADDLTEDFSAIEGREVLLAALKNYFKLHNIAANWEAIEQTAGERLITSLAMICPFNPSEKQALLEAPNLKARVQLLQALIEMALLGSSEDGPRH